MNKKFILKFNKKFGSRLFYLFIYIPINVKIVRGEI